jgi:molybdopterin/thiamine biosynthesis adenylyltransferase
VIAACYIAAAGLRAALGPDFPIRNASPVALSWSQLFGPNLHRLTDAVDIGETYLAGAGAVGHGFLYALRALDVSGTIYVTDPKKVGSGGLNRCLFFGSDDLNHPKAPRLCKVAQPYFPRLTLVPVDKELDEARKLRGEDFLIHRLVVAVDSRRARRSLQAVLPGEVFDASTTDVTEIVLHFNDQPTDLACLSCVYPENDRERLHEENVAEALGLTIDNVRLGFITPALASKISARYPDLTPESLAGRAFDTVYKELCGVGKLKSIGGQQVLAPFSFVSVLAGAYLAVEFVLRVREPEAERFNYWRASPWHSPVPELRQFRPRDPHCEFCSRAPIRRVLENLWKRQRNVA